MVRLPLLILRWKIKGQAILQNLRDHPTRLWHWSVAWPWFAVLCLGGIGFIAVNEPIVGLILLVLSFYSLSSKLWHTRKGLFLKISGTIGIAGVLILTVMATIAYMEDKPWSNVNRFWERFVVLNQISTTARAPECPPNIKIFRSTAIPILSPPFHIKSVGKPIEQPSIVMAPSYGDLKERAIGLSQEIMNDLYLHGWPLPSGQRIDPSMLREQWPSSGAQYPAWIQRRSNYFRFRFYERVFDIRNEFSTLHFRDKRLDDFFKEQEATENINRQLLAAGQKTFDQPISPYTITDVAASLLVLANKIK